MWQTLTVVGCCKKLVLVKARVRVVLHSSDATCETDNQSNSKLVGTGNADRVKYSFVRVSTRTDTVSFETICGTNIIRFKEMIFPSSAYSTFS